MGFTINFLTLFARSFAFIFFKSFSISSLHSLFGISLNNSHHVSYIFHQVYCFFSKFRRLPGPQYLYPGTVNPFFQEQSILFFWQQGQHWFVNINSPTLFLDKFELYYSALCALWFVHRSPFFVKTSRIYTFCIFIHYSLYICI